jgi:hypothetical protein
LAAFSVPGYVTGYRKRASEFEQLAETEPLSAARLRYRIVARHYSELADREERTDKARMAEHLELLKSKRREAAEYAVLSARSLPTDPIPHRYFGKLSACRFVSSERLDSFSLNS